MFGFEGLPVWQKAVDYAGTIYDVTSTFPEEERFGLTSQLRRSSVYIAEASSRSSRIDFNRFIEIAYGPLLESVLELKIAQRQKLVRNTGFETTYKQAEELAKMFSGLRRTIKVSGKS
jgi:four helix bundle protein